MKVPKKGGRIIVTVKDEDKDEIVPIAQGFEEMGIELLATRGTCDAPAASTGVECTLVNQASRKAHPNIRGYDPPPAPST